jgi:hypothetical protein
MYVTRDMVDVALMSGGIAHIAESSPDTATVTRKKVHDNIGLSSQQGADSVKVSFDTELSRHRTTLYLDHSHFMYLYTSVVSHAVGELFSSGIRENSPSPRIQTNSATSPAGPST